MPTRNLPERPSLEYLRKLAKERLATIRPTQPAAKLADAQLAIAREYGFSSWRSLKAEVDRRRAPQTAELFRACAAGELETVRAMLKTDSNLVHARNAAGSTALHEAVRHPEVVKLLLDSGADPTARDAGDHATPLHFAAANGVIDTVRMLLDAGADVHGTGDLHEGDVIGWAARRGNDPVIRLLLERGARHHIFSAMALGDLDLVRRIVNAHPKALSRRRSRFENRQTPLHAAVAPPEGFGGEPSQAMLQLLIELGADLEATDDKGRTAMELAMLRGNHEAVRLLRAARAHEPGSADEEPLAQRLAAASRSVRKSVPMFFVADVRATVRWYESIGFTVDDVGEDGGHMIFARLSFGNGEFTLSPRKDSTPRDVRFWFVTENVEELYRLMEQRQLRAASGTTDEPEVPFEEDLYDPFYGGRQFSVRDLNGLHLIFWQPRV